MTRPDQPTGDHDTTPGETGDRREPQPAPNASPTPPVSGESPPVSGEPPPAQPPVDRPAGLGGTVAALTDEELEPAQRRRLLGRLVAEVRARGIGDLFKPRAALRWVADTLSDIAPYIPIRDLETLRRHHGGLAGDALAERLIRNAARSTAAVGAAGGGVAAIEWAASPTLLSAPVLLAAETVAVVAVEIKLIGELHEVYRRPIPGTGTQRAVALLQAWASRRGISPIAPGAGMAAVLSTTARRELRDRLLRRFGRNLTTLGPLLTGAAVAGYLNRRATRALGEQVRKDLASGPIIDVPTPAELTSAAGEIAAAPHKGTQNTGTQNTGTQNTGTQNTGTQNTGARPGSSAQPDKSAQPSNGARPNNDAGPDGRQAQPPAAGAD
jgi:hypothetical protein